MQEFLRGKVQMTEHHRVFLFLPSIVLACVRRQPSFNRVGQSPWLRASPDKNAGRSGTQCVLSY